ncbi:MAG: NAD(P)/FAD-dependent oxidoreductase [Cryobacterium sp.]
MVNNPGGKRWAVVGGGLLGMTLALRLRQRGATVTLFERAPDLGGLASAWRLDEITWDRHYHVTLLSDSHLRALLSELGLEQEMRWVETRTGFYTDGQLYSMSSSIEFLRFPPLGLISKARLAATILHASRITDWRRLESIPVADWLGRWSGRRTLEKIWLPLLRAKLGDSYRKTSAAFIWATIARMYAARRSGLKREMFGYVPGGYGRILETFGTHLQTSGVELRLGAEVRSVRPGERGVLIVHLGEESTEPFDQVVLTTPAPVAARLCPALSGDEKTRLDGVEYQGIVCASLLLTKPLAGYYITNITDSWVPFTAVIEASAFIDRDQLGGRTLVYLPRYLASGDPDFGVSDDEWRKRFVTALLRMYPHLDEGDILAFRVSRERFVYALPTLGYSNRLPPKHTTIPGLHIINSAHIVNGTLNVNETVKLAESSVNDLLITRDTHGRAR